MKPSGEGRVQDSKGSLTLVVACDAQPFLILRELDIYRFFRKTPKILLVRRGAPFSTDRIP
jgi:hypothetical protein